MVGFNVETCVNSLVSLKQGLKFCDINSQSDLDIIGLNMPNIRQSLFLLLVIDLFPDEVHTGLVDTKLNDHNLHFTDEGQNPKLVWSWNDM